jgi:hypothetical protein
VRDASLVFGNAWKDWCFASSRLHPRQFGSWPSWLAILSFIPILVGRRLDLPLVSLFSCTIHSCLGHLHWECKTRWRISVSASWSFGLNSRIEGVPPGTSIPSGYGILFKLYPSGGKPSEEKVSCQVHFQRTTFTLREAPRFDDFHLAAGEQPHLLPSYRSRSKGHRTVSPMALMSCNGAKNMESACVI